MVKSVVVGMEMIKSVVCWNGNGQVCGTVVGMEMIKSVVVGMEMVN